MFEKLSESEALARLARDGTNALVRVLAYDGLLIQSGHIVSMVASRPG